MLLLGLPQISSEIYHKFHEKILTCILAVLLHRSESEEVKYFKCKSSKCVVCTHLYKIIYTILSFNYLSLHKRDLL